MMRRAAGRLGWPRPGSLALILGLFVLAMGSAAQARGEVPAPDQPNPAASPPVEESPHDDAATTTTSPPADATAPAPGGASNDGGEDAGGGGQTAAAAAGDKTFDLKVRSLEEKVTDLKERIYRTKARLLLLQETVISDNLTSGAKAIIVHRNEMGASFVLESVTYALDGAPIYTKVDTTGELDKQEEIEIFNGRIVPGNHQLTARVVLKGSGFGVFSYLEGYKFTVNRSFTFNAEGGKVTQIKIVSYERGGITTDLKDRPAIKFDVSTSRDQPKRARRKAGGEGEGEK